jgi:hypothetical protein
LCSAHTGHPPSRVCVTVTSVTVCEQPPPPPAAWLKPIDRKGMRSGHQPPHGRVDGPRVDRAERARRWNRAGMPCLVPQPKLQAFESLSLNNEAQRRGPGGGIGGMQRLGNRAPPTTPGAVVKCSGFFLPFEVQLYIQTRRPFPTQKTCKKRSRRSASRLPLVGCRCVATVDCAYPAHEISKLDVLPLAENLKTRSRRKVSRLPLVGCRCWCTSVVRSKMVATVCEPLIEKSLGLAYTSAGMAHTHGSGA